MKKILYSLLVFSMVFASCEPLEDINNIVDATEIPIVGKTEYTLIDTDYSALNLENGRLGSVEEVNEKLPAFLTDKFNFLGNESEVTLGYNLYIGDAFGLENYELKVEDYKDSGSLVEGFQNSVNPLDHLVKVIESNFPTPKEGDYVSTKYIQYTGSTSTVTPLVSFDENFDYGDTAGDLTTISGNGWVNHSGAPNQLLYTTDGLSMTDYPSSDIAGAISLSSANSEDVNKAFTSDITSGVVYSSALMNLSEVGGGTYFFHLMEEDGSFAFSARLGAKTDGAGNILFGIGASSSSLTYGTTPFNLNTTYLVVTSYNTVSGVSNLYVLDSALETEPSTPEATSTGKSGNSAKRIGIRQGSGGPTGTIDGIRVANTWSGIMKNGTLPGEVIGEKVTRTTMYNYLNGAWKTPSTTDDFYTLTEADFTSIGVESFGSSVPADDYLPKFLDIKFPYALEGSKLDVVYNYESSSSGVQIRGNLYTKTNGVWVGHEATIETTLLFIHNGTIWEPVYATQYTLTEADYELVGNGRFNNFDARAGRDEETIAARVAKISTILLNNFPTDAEGQEYIVTYDIFDGEAKTLTIEVKKTGGVYIKK